jgi:hypothetical protein
MRISYKIIIPSILVLALPLLTYAGLIPCDGTATDPCDINMVIDLFNGILQFLIFTIAAPACALLIMYAGWLYMTSGEKPGNRTTANEIFTNTVVGFCLLLAAWLVIQVILVTLGLDADFSPYFDFN